MVTAKWTLSEYTLTEIESMAGRTLAQAYFDTKEVKEDRLLVAYNDEPPNAKGNSKYGHLKGVVVADKSSGFWLVHSVPLYPNITSKSPLQEDTLFCAISSTKLAFSLLLANPSDYHFPSTGMIYGQSYLCLSLSANQIDIVGEQLIFNEPQIYLSQLPESLSAAYPNIQRLIEGKRINNGPYWNDVDLTTFNGDVFKSFAKSSKFAKELYEDYVRIIVLRTNQLLLMTTPMFSDCTYLEHQFIR